MNNFIFIYINEKKYAIEPSCIKEIIKIPKISAVPNAKQEIIGVINYQGTPLPVFDISPLFNQNVNLDNHQKIIIANILKENIGILINKIYKIGELKREDLLDNVDYTALLNSDNVDKIKSSSQDLFLIKIIGDSESEMLFLRFIICIDILKNAGEIISSSFPIEDIENDNINSFDLLFIFSPNDVSQVDKINNELSQVSEILKTDYFKIEDKDNLEKELQRYFNKTQGDIILLDLEKLEKILSERYELGQ
jgi:chemotaxis signal transduction protein